MEFWPENQGQTPLYSKFGTVPGRNCTHNYHDRHQVPHYPLYYGEQQDPGRESSYWTVPGSRTGGAPQEYTNWTDQELTAPTSSHFPFILDRHAQQHQDLRDYQPHDARDREWTAAQRAAKEYERGFLREGWQRRWEPCGPGRYNREASAKRSDSSYRELEAWAARYSHSLPRRRRIEAELRGASQGLLESSRAPERDSRTGTDPRVAALQQARQSAGIRESGLWDRGSRQQAPTYYPSQTPATDTSHVLDVKEKASYQRRMFSQPPGYIAPPPYDIPHKSSPVLHHLDTSWEQEGKRQTYWSQPTLRKQDVCVDLRDHRKGEKEPDGNQKSFPELEGLKHSRQETDALQARSPLSVQETRIQLEGMLSLQQPQVLQAIENKKINVEPSSKVIEGRKFRLNKKAGGMTIFCLVSRIAGTTETSSLPLCTSQTNTQNTELGGVSKGLRDDSGVIQTHKLADEVDFRAQTLTEQSSTSDARNAEAKQKETPTSVESEMLEDYLSNKAQTDISPEKKTNDADSAFGRQVSQSEQPVSVKYPLWRQPSITSRVESLSTCLKANNKEGESDVLDSGKVHPIDVEVRRLDIKTDTESGDSKGLLVIDTTCVVVKMELIPSPKKEHVYYVHTEHSPLDIQLTDPPETVQANSQLNEDVTTDNNTETDHFHINESPETDLDSDVMEQKAPKEESEISSLCMSSSSVSERETLEERAERILGIPLHDCITEQQLEDATSLLDSFVQDQEVEPSPVKGNDTDDRVEEIQEDTREEEQTQNLLEVDQTDDAKCLIEYDDVRDGAAGGGSGDFAGFQDQVSEAHEIDSQIETDIKPFPEIEITEDPLINPPSEEGTTEQEENDTSSLNPPQCPSPPAHIFHSSLLLPFPDCESPNPALSLTLASSDLTPLMLISESDMEGPDPELIALNSPENLVHHPETSYLPHTPSAPPLGSTDLTLHTDYPPSPAPPDLSDQTAEAVSSVEDHDEECVECQLIISETGDTLEDPAKDMTEELVSQQKSESGQPDDDAYVNESNVTDKQQTKEASKDPTDHIIEETLKISKESAIEVDILQQQLECVQAEDVVCAKESYMTEEPLQKEVNQDPTDVLEKTISQENLLDSQSQTELNILQQQFDNGQEKDAYVNESYTTEDLSQKKADEDPAGLLGQTLSIENATDSSAQIEAEILQNIEPETLPSNSLAHALNKTDAEFVPILEMDSVCSTALNQDAAPAADISETVPPPLHLGCCECLQFISSSCTDSVQPSSSSTPLLQEGNGGVDPDSPLKDEPQYPKSLWDAVNRIRKHTAPDSENEEEEVIELWDPESVGEDLGCPDVVAGMNSERAVFDRVGQQEVSLEGSSEAVEVGQIQQGLCQEGRSGHAEEDTLSCSSTSSHGSGDTVIVADEDKVEETTHDAVSESKIGRDEGIQTTEGERCCFTEVKDETATEEDGDNDGDESVTNESSQSEECPAEVAKITTKDVEKIETEPRK